ncbi:hypothetical protein [Microvirga sp. TS319]|uniref:hypothetical protein n=1 Tax=Microvirga sp. TS319 TaxID=3241165 RepID=UPI00351A9A4C
MAGKHPKTKSEERPRSDLDVDPGIGRSKGTTMAGEDPHNLDGGSTFKGGIDPDRMGRTNK